MITRALVYTAPGFDPYENLAVEETLLKSAAEGDCVLLLWQNERTVVIGKNQNPWKECRTALLEEEGGSLARRLSGGGAVFHDRGNLNVSFLVGEKDFDVPRQLAVVERALRGFGVPAAFSGRNDLLADGRKFSGSAYYRTAGRACQHCTLMLDVDAALLARYLSPSRAKLESKGVDSVRSRVVNLREFAPQLTIEALKEALIAAFSEVCGLPAEALRLTQAQREQIAALAARNRSEDWLYGARTAFTFSAEDRFPWGGAELSLQVEHGVIRAAKLYTDAMDERLAPRVEAALRGLPYRLPALEEALRTAFPASVAGDLLSLLRKGF